MLNYPMIFTVNSESQEGIKTLWQTHAPTLETKVPMAIPPEFDGPGGGFSPEDIYAMALQNCFIATFKVFAEKSRLHYSEIKITTALTVNRNEKGQPWMAKAHFKITLDKVLQPDNAKRILEKTSQNCMILNSVNTEKTFEFIISTLEA